MNSFRLENEERGLGLHSPQSTLRFPFSVEAWNNVDCMVSIMRSFTKNLEA